MKKIISILVIFLFGIVAVLAQESHDSEIEEGKKLVETKISCDKLSNEQLEAIGDYYMEQMHPGEAHEIMDNMMGGEGSESLKQVHINMAKTIYCGESGSMMGSKMMNMMGGVNMMGSGMMGNFGYGMMGGLGYGYGLLFWVIQILVIVILALLAVWLYQKVTERRR